MKNLLLQLTIILCLIITPVLLGQTVHKVAAGTDGINTALAGAASGDIIELTTSGGEYIETTMLSINFGITICAAEGLAEKPVIYPGGEHGFEITQSLGSDLDNYWFNLIGVKIVGVGPTDTLKGQVIKIGTGAAYHSMLIDNCTFQNLSNKISWPADQTTYCDSLIFTNNYMINAKDGIRAMKGVIGTFIAENNTIWNCSPCQLFSVTREQNTVIGEFVNPKIIIKNLTVYGTIEKFPFMVIDGDSSVIKNIIISNRDYDTASTSGGGVLRVTGFGTVISNLLQDSCGSGPVKLNEFGTFGGNAILDSATYMLNTDPMFEDKANGIFNLLSGSPAIGFADDGGNLGDRRWTGITSSVENNENRPVKFSLVQNYPNPFNPSTKIDFTTEKSGNVKLQIFNMLGQLIETLFDGNLSAGQHSLTWKAGNHMSGIYLYRLTSGNNVQVRKMTLLK